MDINLHSYTFRDFPLDDALGAAAKLGYSALELHQVHCNPSYIDEELPKCLAMAARHGVPVNVVDFKADLIQADSRAADEATALLERVVRAAAKHGIRKLNGFTGFLTGANPAAFSRNGSAIAGADHYSRCAERLARAARVAEECGVTLLLEIHMNTIHDTVTSALQLLALVDSPALALTPDPGNMFATNVADRDPECLVPLAGRIGYVHFKNCVQRGEEYDYSVSLANGQIDIPRWLGKLRTLGYTGPLCIEYVGDGDPLAAAAADIAYLKQCLEGLAQAPAGHPES